MRFLRGIGGLLAITEVAGTSTNIFLPIADQVGTIHALVAAVTNNVTLSTPTIAARYEYSPFGELLERDGPYATSCPFGFQSKYRDAETGFWYFGYRYFDSRAAQWLTHDPLREEGGFNLAAFCGGDPVNKVDPLGLATMPNSVVFDPVTGRTTVGLDVAEVASWVGQPSRVLTQSGFEAGAFYGRLAAQPAVASADRFVARWDYYQSPWLALNQSLNPMVQFLVSAEEVRSGLGQQYHNSGRALSGGERWMSGGRAAWSLGESALFAGAAVSTPVGQWASAAIETSSAKQATVLLAIHHAVRGPMLLPGVEAVDLAAADAGLRGGHVRFRRPGPVPGGGRGHRGPGRPSHGPGRGGRRHGRHGALRRDSGVAAAARHHGDEPFWSRRVTMLGRGP